MKKNVTWILIADGATARIFANDGPGKGLQPAVPNEFKHLQSRTRELGVERPGRTSGRSTPKSAIEPHVDWHREEKAKFGRDMAGVLDAAAGRKSFDRLILVAPPRTLAELRHALSPKTKELVQAELGKDLTNVPFIDLPKHLEDLLAL